MSSLSIDVIFRATLTQLDEENQAKLEKIISDEAKKDQSVLLAAKDMMEMLQDANVIKNFLGKLNKAVKTKIKRPLFSPR